jgi:hypothetical protein
MFVSIRVPTPILAILTLGASLYALFFHADDGLGEQLACEPRIRAEAFPVAAAIS